MLLQLHDWLDLGNSADASFWAICLVAFYGVSGKSHLFPVLTSSFDMHKQLTKADFKIFLWGVLITIRWRKTIQFLEQIVEIPLLAFPVPNYVPQQPSQMPFALRQQRLLSTLKRSTG